MRTLSEISQSPKDKYCDPLTKVPKIVIFIETKWEGGCQGLEGVKSGEFNGYGVSVVQN